MNKKEIKKILYKISHMGCRENDILFSHINEAYLYSLSQDELMLLKQLIDENDNDILAWLTNTQSVPLKYKDIIKKIVKLL